MSSWDSTRFGNKVHLTHHAVDPVARRGLSEGLIRELIETGNVKQKDSEHWWIFKRIEGRDDNLICAAVISRQALIVKTVMTHWEECRE